MKKLLVAFAPLVNTVMADMPITIMEDVVEMPERMAETMANLSWKMKLMIYWHSLSTVHKLIAVGLIAIVILFILCKIFKCKKKCGSC
ncbi:hypothetical protein KAZ82_02400 [Candidatus Babeliales bacterium]|nr:hypothetical protein [Candidatus Babeliales bacterium]